jgi:hypothetical protein
LQTVVLVSHDGHVIFEERDRDAATGVFSPRRFEFDLEPCPP